MKQFAMAVIGLALAISATFSGATANEREASDTLIKLVKEFEGYRETAYDDLNPERQLSEGDDHLVQGTLTIGWGCTTGVYAGQRITFEKAEKCLRTYLADAQRVVDESVIVPINHNQRDALASFVFNVGASAFKDSTLLRRLNAGDYDGAEAEFHRWVYSEGRKLDGLARRRAYEAALFAQPTGDGAAHLPIQLLSDPSVAPDIIRIPRAVTQAMQSAWATSFPSGRSAASREVGGVLVAQSDGSIVAKYMTIGSNTSVLPDRATAEKNGERVVGTFHTHPYSDIWEEGGHLGVAHSGDDFTYALFHRDPMFVEAGSKHFLLLPTAASPDHPYETWNAFGSRYLDELNKLTLKGIPVPEAHIIVGKRYAKQLSIAFYEGVNGVFRRIA